MLKYFICVNVCGVLCVSNICDTRLQFDPLHDYNDTNEKYLVYKLV